MKRKCFNCGAQLPYNSLRCQECGYMPDVSLMQRCPDLEVARCSLTGLLCKHMGFYQTCSIKNKADEEF